MTKKQILIYKTNLANMDPEKVTRAALGSSIFYLFLKTTRDFDAFISVE